MSFTVGIIILFVVALVCKLAMGPTKPGTSVASSNPSSRIICPQCQVGGKVRTSTERRKVGISGGKATAALLTGGVSLIATGLSRKETVTRATCGNCGSTWVF